MLRNLGLRYAVRPRVDLTGHTIAVRRVTAPRVGVRLAACSVARAGVGTMNAAGGIACRGRYIPRAAVRLGAHGEIARERAQHAAQARRTVPQTSGQAAALEPIYNGRAVAFANEVASLRHDDALRRMRDAFGNAHFTALRSADVARRVPVAVQRLRTAKLIRITQVARGVALLVFMCTPDMLIALVVAHVAATEAAHTLAPLTVK